MAPSNGLHGQHQQLADPEERLAAMTKEFGEFGGVNGSVEVSAVFRAMKVKDLSGIFQGRLGPDEGSYLYGRHFNPTLRHLGRQLAALEGTEAGYPTASGLSAVACTILNICSSGDHIVASHTLYGGTFAMLNEFLPQKMGITTTFVPLDDLAAVRAAIQPNTKVLYAETLSNPTLSAADLPVLADAAHANDLTFVVDNTFAPLVVSPARWGVDVVVQSLTKYVSGAADIIAGAICASKQFIDQLMDLHTGPLMMLGPTMDPRIASDLSLRLPHLALRVREHSRRALAFAQRLQQEGLDVSYPGLKTHPHNERLEALCNPGYGHGGMLTLNLHSYQNAGRFMESAQNEHQFGLIAVSLGYFDTLLSASASSTSSHLSEEDLKKADIKPGLVRMSVGLTGSLEQRLQQLVSVLKDSSAGQQATSNNGPAAA